MKLRVAHCIYDDPQNPWVAGGGAVRVLELYRRLHADVEVTVATGNYPGARDDEIDGVRYVRLGASGPYAWSRLTYAAAARRFLARGGYDAGVFDFSVYTPLSIPGGSPVGITVHHVTGPSATERWGRVGGALVRGTERHLLSRARVFSATSSATFELLKSLLPRDSIVHLVEAGVPDDLFALRRDDAGYLLYFGRLDWFQKGLDTLLDAMTLLVAARPTLRLRIAGRGKDAARVMATAQRLGIAGNVDVARAATEEEKRALFSGASVLLMPSRFEGFGMVAAEAMAAGIPIVAASAGSLPEVIAPPAGGRLVPPADPAALAAEVGRLLDDPDARAALSASARVSAERYRWDRIAKGHLRFLYDIQRHSSRTGR